MDASGSAEVAQVISSLSKYQQPIQMSICVSLYIMYVNHICIVVGLGDRFRYRHLWGGRGGRGE